ncbi:MAG: hypothetical protein UR27_C0002G0006 [Candidatus Peregrinibacteria bacterium GW2011_GWA2_33_10]|nr:MAG: hypothetical protein UR27_C0002G0006 [Candidatus Peregrinibacteria bacterium GW2011_GWA2_33_10]
MNKKIKMFAGALMVTVFVMSIFYIVNKQSRDLSGTAQLKLEDISTSDLTITNVRITPTKPIIGNKINMAVNVKNEGSEVLEGFSISAKDQTGWGTVKNETNLAPKGEVIVNLELNTLEKDKAELLSNNPHSFDITVDIEDSIKEFNEGNNGMKVFLNIREQE